MAVSPSSSRALRSLVALVCLFSVMQACGGRSDTEDYVFGSDGTISVAAAPSTAGRGTGGRPAGGAPATGGVGNTAGRAMGGMGAIAGTAIGEAGEPAIIAGSGGIAGGGGVAGSGGAPSWPITCGTQVCDADAEICCLSGDFACVPKGGACGGVSLGCTTAADCAGNGVCCISLTGDPGEASACKPSCDLGGPGRDRQLCTTDADCLLGGPRFCRALVFGVKMCVFRP